jgi:preprotein translocase subunit YajC
MSGTTEFLLVGVVLVLALGAYWSLVIFPRQREFQKQQRYVQSVQAGDDMITFGGMIVKVIDIDADSGVALVEIAPNVQVRLLTSALMRPFDPDELRESIARARGERPAAEAAPSSSEQG